MKRSEALPLQLISLYLGIFNATMIARSIGQDLDKGELKSFKISLFQALEHLIAKMKSGTLRRSEIRKTISKLVRDCDVSWGQAQKGINVILKCHQFLFHLENQKLKRELDCPLDSVVLGKIGVRKSLRQIKQQEEYAAHQDRIYNAAMDGGMTSSVDFDKYWDEQNLRRAGLL